MFKNAQALAQTAAASAAKPAQAQEAAVAVNRLFMLFHGYYGSLFLSKFSTGDLDTEGKDRGIKNARIVWSSELRDYPAEVIEDAAARAKAQYAEFPPSLPQFLALVKAAAPRNTFKSDHPQVKAIAMGAELKSSHSRRIREEAIAKARAKIAETEASPVDGLQGLVQLIGKAVGNAGGDEARELKRLNYLFANA